ncbi:TRPT1 [Symbiodinium sp. CCMP2592]|nr:TRPT1 [Symbiodinium sp. CCMP2592]
MFDWMWEGSLRAFDAPGSYTIALQACGVSKRWQEAVRLHQSLPKMQITPDPVACVAVLEALSHHGLGYKLFRAAFSRSRALRRRPRSSRVACEGSPERFIAVQWWLAAAFPQLDHHPLDDLGSPQQMMPNQYHPENRWPQFWAQPGNCNYQWPNGDQGQYTEAEWMQWQCEQQVQAVSYYQQPLRSQNQGGSSQSKQKNPPKGDSGRRWKSGDKKGKSGAAKDQPKATPVEVETKPLSRAEAFADASGAKGSKAAGGWGDGLTRDVKISKTLTQILRHKAPELGLGIQPDGYCLLEEVLACPWLKELDATWDIVQKVVQKSDKKRFELQDVGGSIYIRAVQGHSIKVIDDDKLLKKLELEPAGELPKDCVHGTYRRHFESIRKVGLLAGGGQGQGFRNHVHFAPYAPGDKRVISGMRYDCEIAIWIDLKRAIADGVPFYISANQVILSPGIKGIIDKKYFLKARDLQKKEDLKLEVADQALLPGMQ